MISLGCDGKNWEGCLLCNFVCRAGTLCPGFNPGTCDQSYEAHEGLMHGFFAALLQPQLLAGGTPQQGWDPRENVAYSLCAWYHWHWQDKTAPVRDKCCQSVNAEILSVPVLSPFVLGHVWLAVWQVAIKVEFLISLWRILAVAFSIMG